MKRGRADKPNEGSSEKQPKNGDSPLVMSKSQTISATKLNAMISKQRQDEQNGPLELSDLFNECLESIFKYLEFNDMFNMAESDVRFIPMIRLAFSRRYRTKELHLNFCEQKFRDENGSIEIPKDVSATTFINVIGQNLSKLTVFCMTVDATENELSLLKSLATSLPKLQYLVVTDEAMKMPVSTIERMLQMNQQLKTFDLVRDYSIGFLQSINQWLPHLEELTLKVPADRFQSLGDQTLQFQNVKKFVLSTSFVNGEFVVKMPFSFEKLERLYMGGLTKMNGQTFSFIKENKEISELKMITKTMTYDDLSSVVKALPKLTSLMIAADTLTSLQRRQLLKECYRSNMTQLRMSFFNLSKCYEFIVDLDEEYKTKWTITVWSSKCTIWTSELRFEKK